MRRRTHGKQPARHLHADPESIRYLGEDEKEEKRQAADDERAERFRQLYAMLNLEVVCHKDRSLEVSWGADCSEWLSPE